MVYERKTLMSITADCHLHTSFSGDSQAPMEDMISRGMELGLREMTFTEHMDFDYLPIPGEAPDYFEVDTDSYHKKYLEMKERFEGKIKLNFGIELGMQTHVNERNTEYSKSFPFDFIIASSHLCRRLDPYNADFWEGRLEKDGMIISPTYMRSSPHTMTSISTDILTTFCDMVPPKTQTLFLMNSATI